MRAGADRREGGGGPLIRWRARVAGLPGLWALAAAFGLGVVGAAAHAPLFLWPLLLISVTGFVWLMDGAAAREARLRAGLSRGFAFGAGYFLVSFFWLGNAFVMRGPEFAPFAPLGVLAMGLGLALIWGAAGFACALFWRDDWRRIIRFALIFTLAELVRGHLFGGLPWNLAAHVWPAGGAVSQSAALFGAYGLTALTWFAFAAPAALGGPDRLGLARAAPGAAAFAIFAVLYAAGVGRLVSAPEDVTPGVRLRIVQADINQREKWRPENRDAVVERYLALTRAPGIETRTHVIWPESALPLYLLDEPRVLDEVARAVGPDRVLMTGLVRVGGGDPLRPEYYNSFIVLPIVDGRPQLEALTFYDKHRLVPFGEYLPLSNALGGFFASVGLASLANLAEGGYTPGPGPATIDAAGAPPVSPQICYETVFSGFTPRGAQRPGWIANVSNDAWFGAAVGPLQNFNQSRYRAIEEGLPVVRATTGGVSAVIDGYGRTVARAPVADAAVVDAALPAPAPPTLYALVGDAGVAFFIALGVAIGFVRGRANLRSQPSM